MLLPSSGDDSGSLAMGDGRQSLRSRRCPTGRCCRCDSRACARSISPTRRELDADVATVTRSVCVLQAQSFDAARHQIRVRSAGNTAADVDRAFEEERSVVRTWLMRGTWHLCAADDVRWLIGIFGPVNRPAWCGSHAESRSRRCHVCARRRGDPQGARGRPDGAS